MKITIEDGDFKLIIDENVGEKGSLIKFGDQMPKIIELIKFAFEAMMNYRLAVPTK